VEVLIEIENFIEDNFCDYFVEHHKKNFKKLDSKKNPDITTQHGITKILFCEEQAYRVKDIHYKVLLSKLNYLIKSYCKDSLINYSQIVEWPKKSFQEEHIDFDYHTFTSIIYLNDSYSGGETIVGDKILKPKKGKIILFNGNKIKHQVLEISSGIRYTNATWYITPKKRR
jgi:hypothetical protein